MLKIIKKIAIYSVLILLGLELLVRFFHLHNERPVRYLDTKEVEKWVPNQTGYSVTGNRRQNVGAYRINDFGFNSVHKNFSTSKDSLEIAIVGDSFIEGFHEDVTNSLGQQVEKKVAGSKVIELGYAGYDLADQLHLISTYEDLFKEMDHTFIYLKYTDDLDRSSYEISSRLGLNTPISRIIKKIKFLVYFKDIGLLDPLTQLPKRILSTLKNKKIKTKTDQELRLLEQEKDVKRLDNFISLIKLYPMDSHKSTFLLDKSLCSPMFLEYLDTNNFKVLDFGEVLDQSKEETTLIYDQHWSKHGRELMRNVLVNYINNLPK